VEPSLRDHARRNRMIAIAAGVVAIVLGFAGDFLGMPWHWMRPAAELLLLAELVGLVVLERHQLFEPVHETVSGIDKRVADLQAGLEALTKETRSASQVTLCANASEVLRGAARVTHEALARDHAGPQILRIGALSGMAFAQDARDAALEIQEYMKVFLAYLLSKDSPSDSRARRWSIRLFGGVASVPALDSWMELGGPAIALNPLNLEVKIFAKLRVQSLLSPQTITDRDTALVFDDASAAFRWGLMLEGVQYASLFARWFDDLWASVPDTHLVYSRKGLDQQALDLLRSEIAAIEAAQVRQTS
jgi:hypothetical protein